MAPYTLWIKIHLLYQIYSMAFTKFVLKTLLLVVLLKDLIQCLLLVFHILLFLYQMLTMTNAEAIDFDVTVGLSNCGAHTGSITLDIRSPTSREGRMYSAFLCEIFFL